MALSVYVVDDHALFRRVAKTLLEAEGYEIAGEASSGETALDELEKAHPDVVLLDVQLPGIDGFEVARRISETEHPPAVLLTSTRPADAYGDLMGAAHARGFIQKQDLSGQTVASLLASG
jgi:DNA-binding NarL/FixJ family response regulator